MRAFFAVLALTLASCGSAPEKQAIAVAPPPVKDHRILLLAEHQTSASLVPDHLLDNKVLPGGTLGEYENAGRKYQLFIIETPDPQKAAFLMLDLKATLQDPAYIAYMGGYFAGGNKPVYVFAKKQFLAGVVGLPMDTADPIARQLAARL